MKVLLVHANRPSNWLSCQMIRENIVQSYGLLPKTFEIRHVELASEAEAMRFGRFRLIQNFVQTCLEWRPDKIAFVDNFPHPLEAMTALRHASPSFSADLIFHIYGNFTWEAKHWFELGELIRGEPARFFVASPRQKLLVESFLAPQASPSSPVDVLPFSIDSELFFWDPELRARGRAQLNLPEDTKMILYSGRLSLQKGVDRLVNLVANARKYSKAPLCLVLAGEADDRGAPLLGLPLTLGHFFKKTSALYVDRDAHSWVKPLGPVRNQDLPALYCAADLVASIGFHHDEDFGMAIAEAGLCGSPLLLSNWGGFAGFKISDECQLVDSKISQVGLEFSTSDALTKLLEILSIRPSFAAREKQSQLFIERFSVAKVADQLQSYLESQTEVFTRFGGFSDKLFKFSLSFRSDSPGFSARMASGSLYESVYRNYLESMS